MADKNVLGALLEFLKTTKIGSRERTGEREVEWKQQYDWVGEDLLND